MKNIASLLYGYFVFKKIKSVRFISPLNKMKINQEISVEMLSKCQNKAETKKQQKNWESHLRKYCFTIQLS